MGELVDRSVVDFEALMPADTPAYMFDAWIGCIQFAIGEPEIVAEFRRDTGNQWEPGRNGFERLIDESTGIQADFVLQFVLWVNANIWGPIDGPVEEQA